MHQLCGFEAADPLVDGLHPVSNGSYATDHVYSGDYSYRCSAFQVAFVEVVSDRNLDQDGNLFEVGFRYLAIDFAFRVDALPTGPAAILALHGWGDGETRQLTNVTTGPPFDIYLTDPPLSASTLYDIAQLRLLPDGAVEHYNPRYGEWLLRSGPGVIAPGQWYHAHLRGHAALRSTNIIDMSIAGVTSAWTANPALDEDPSRSDGLEIAGNLPHRRGFSSVYASVGNLGVPGNVWVDDLRFRSPSGRLDWLHYWDGEFGGHSVEGFTPNPSRAFLLRPTGTINGGAWTQPSGSAANLHESLNNQPPTGAADPGVDGSQIRSEGTERDTIKVELESPVEAGVPGDQLVVSLTAVLGHAAGTLPAPAGEVWPNYGGRSAPSEEYWDYSPQPFGFGAVAGAWPSGWTATYRVRDDVAAHEAGGFLDQVPIPRNYRPTIDVTRVSAGEGHLALVGLLVETIPAHGWPVEEANPQWVEPGAIASPRVAFEPVVATGAQRRAFGTQLIDLAPGATEKDNQFFAHVDQSGAITLLGQYWDWPIEETAFFSFLDFGRLDLAPADKAVLSVRFDLPDPWFVEKEYVTYHAYFGELRYADYPWLVGNLPEASHPGYVRLLRERYVHPLPTPVSEAVVLGGAHTIAAGVVRLG